MADWNSPVAGMVMSSALFWKNKRVLITGHTGFKGSWLSLWLQSIGAEVFGYEQKPITTPNLYELCQSSNGIRSFFGDIGNLKQLEAVLKEVEPEIVFHLAAQPLVRYSYHNPVETFQTNVIGTVNLLEVARRSDSVKVVVNVTSDKCYRNLEVERREFIENDPMGGFDPYSSSKGCAELVTQAYRSSFYSTGGKYLASARAGNVIGGGDWSQDRLVPDMIRSVLNGVPMVVRNPAAVRPWQHVLDSLHGYLKLAEHLWEHGDEYAEGWNFGPGEDSLVTVEELIRIASEAWGSPIEIKLENEDQLHEASYLMLDSTKAKSALNWSIDLPVRDAIEWTMNWYKSFAEKEDMKQVTLDQIRRFNELRGLNNGN